MKESKKTMIWNCKFLAVIFIVMAIMSTCSVKKAGAASFDSALGTATANIPAGADVAGMGNAWVASPEFSSNNPAVIAVVDKDFKIGGSATYGRINFGQGPDVNIYSGTVAGKMSVGVLQLTYSKAGSGTSETLMDVDAKFNSTSEFSILYGAKVAKDFLKQGDELYLGAGFSPGSKSKMTFSVEDQKLIQAISKGSTWMAGALYRLNENVNFGVSYSQSRDKAESYDFLADEVAKSVSRTKIFRTGVGVQVAEMTFIAVDYQHLNLDGFKKDQIFAGIEQGIIKDLLYVYGGLAGSFKSPTAGIGVYGKKYGLNVAYMHNPFNELKPYLGKNSVIMVMLSLSF